MNLYFQEGTLDEHVAIFPSSYFGYVKTHYEYSTDITNYKEEIMSLEKRIKQLDNKAAVAKSDDPDDSQKEIPTVTPSDEVNTVTPSVDVNDKLSKVKQKLDYVQSLLQAVTTNAGNILQSICQYLKAQNLINILDCKVIVLFDHVEGNHWRFLMLLNMHLLLNTNSNPDELCGYLYYDPYNSNSITKPVNEDTLKKLRKLVMG